MLPYKSYVSSGVGDKNYGAVFLHFQTVKKLLLPDTHVMFLVGISAFTQASDIFFVIFSFPLVAVYSVYPVYSDQARLMCIYFSRPKWCFRSSPVRGSDGCVMRTPVHTGVEWTVKQKQPWPSPLNSLPNVCHHSWRGITAPSLLWPWYSFQIALLG